MTFTSGTTGAPRRVCLSSGTMLAVARSLADAMAPLAIERHLVALPLPVLLENLAGVYAPLWHGSGIVVPPLAAVGLTGSSSFEPATLDAMVRREHANSVITLPQMLRAWTAWRNATGRTSRAELRFVAVGGAAVGRALIEQAALPGSLRTRATGCPKGRRCRRSTCPVRIAPAASAARCRTREFASPPTPRSRSPVHQCWAMSATRDTARLWRTGDLGEIDADGFVHVHGRKKHVLITGFGRNVSPEWVEAALRSFPRSRRLSSSATGRPPFLRCSGRPART